VPEWWAVAIGSAGLHTHHEGRSMVPPIRRWLAMALTAPEAGSFADMLDPRIRQQLGEDGTSGAAWTSDVKQERSVMDVALALPNAVLGVAIATGRGAVAGVGEGGREDGAVSQEQELCLKDPVLATIQLLVSCMGQDRMIFRAQGWPLLRSVLSAPSETTRSLQHRLLRDLIPALLLARTDSDEDLLSDVSLLELLLVTIRPSGLASLASSFFGNDAAIKACRDIGQVRDKSTIACCSCIYLCTLSHSFFCADTVGSDCGSGTMRPR
jgi:hypothetical protein